jgi:hypothetical protein
VNATYKIVGRTPWSVRVPLDPLFALEISKPTRASAADQGSVPQLMQMLGCGKGSTSRKSMWQ